MASPQSAYVTAVPDDYDIEQPSSPTDSEASASIEIDSLNWSDFNSTTPYTISSSPPRSTSSSRKRPYDSAPKPCSSHTHSRSMSQKWHQIITSSSCPQSLSANPNSLNEITQELSQRDQTDNRIRRSRSKQIYDEEQRRRLSWAMEMILRRPEESAEVCATLRKAGS